MRIRRQTEGDNIKQCVKMSLIFYYFFLVSFLNIQYLLMLEADLEVSVIRMITMKTYKII